jgi:ELWxxDGT repeat protein
MVNAGGTVYYYDSAPDHGGLQLWRSDGTPDGTKQVSETTIALGPELEWGTPAPPIPLGKLLLFMARDTEHGSELWASDGTAEGTRLVKDIQVGKDGSQPFGFTVAGGKVFFVATTKANGRGLWVSDGSAEGTMLVRDIKPAPPEPSDRPQRFVEPAGGLCRLDPIRPDSALRSYGDMVYFMADDGEHGCELWRSDGTPAGTAMVADINPGKGDISRIRQGMFLVAPIVVGPGNRLYFAADDGSHGLELWASDGTADGTTMISDAYPGAHGANPGNMTSAGGRLYFAADDGAHGVELWSTDGTSAGTAMVADLNPGLPSAAPYGMTRAGAKLFFGADDGHHGGELWALPIEP